MTPVFFLMSLFQIPLSTALIDVTVKSGYWHSRALLLTQNQCFEILLTLASNRPSTLRPKFHFCANFGDENSSSKTRNSFADKEQKIFKKNPYFPVQSTFLR